VTGSSPAPTDIERAAIKEGYRALIRAKSPTSHLVELVVFGLSKVGMLASPETAAVAAVQRRVGYEAAIEVMRSEKLPMSVGLLEAQLELDKLDGLTPSEVTVYRASHDSIVFGLYTTAQAAREHCEAYARREHVGPSELKLWWREDEDTVNQPEEGEAELIESTAPGYARPTGYVVTPLTVASAYDPEVDE
jgi:hypothetical protein